MSFVIQYIIMYINTVYPLVSKRLSVALDKSRKKNVVEDGNEQSIDR